MHSLRHTIGNKCNPYRVICILYIIRVQTIKLVCYIFQCVADVNNVFLVGHKNVYSICSEKRERVEHCAKRALKLTLSLLIHV